MYVESHCKERCTSEHKNKNKKKSRWAGNSNRGVLLGVVCLNVIVKPQL